MKHGIFLYINELAWLCWQSEANPSLPAKVGNAGRFRQKAARAATDTCRKSQHVNALDVPLPNLASRENPARSREANTADEGFGTRSRPNAFKIAGCIHPRGFP